MDRFSDKTVISGPDMAVFLARLEAAGCIERRGAWWFLSPQLAAELPRTRGGALSTGSDA